MTDKLKLESRNLILPPDKVEQKPKSIKCDEKRALYTAKRCNSKIQEEDTEFTKRRYWECIYFWELTLQEETD